mgnify:CR=1 FL=1
MEKKVNSHVYWRISPLHEWTAVSFNNACSTIPQLFKAWWQPRQSLWEFSRRWKPSTAFWVFTDLLSNSPKCSPRFLPDYEGTENMFNFLNKIIIFQRERRYTKCICILNFLSWNCNFSQLGDRANHIAHVIFMLHSAMKTHL